MNQRTSIFHYSKSCGSLISVGLTKLKYAVNMADPAYHFGDSSSP